MDAKVRTKLRGEIRAIQKKLGVTTIMVTHDQEEALTMADKVIVMNNSVVEQVGSPREIYSNPFTHFVAGFIGSMNFLDTAEGVQAIRPERVKIIRSNESFDMMASIADIEFKGPLTRIYAQTQKKAEISVELPTQEFDDMKLSAGERIFLRLPEEYVSHYNGTVMGIAI